MTKKFTKNSVFIDINGNVNFYDPKDPNVQIVKNKKFTEILILSGTPVDEERMIKESYVLHENMAALNICLRK